MVGTEIRRSDSDNVQLRSVSFLRSDQLAAFVKESAQTRTRYGRTILYVIPANVTHLTPYVNMVLKL